ACSSPRSIATSIWVTSVIADCAPDRSTHLGASPRETPENHASQQVTIHTAVGRPQNKPEQKWTKVPRHFCEAAKRWCAWPVSPLTQPGTDSPRLFIVDDDMEIGAGDGDVAVACGGADFGEATSTFAELMAVLVISHPARARSIRDLTSPMAPIKSIFRR